MRSIRQFALACTLAAAAMVPVGASAQGLPNQDTFFTFSQPVELPGMTLPAGTYLFQLVDSPSNRHVVRIMSQDRQKLHTTVMSIPNYSVERPSDKPEIRFLESSETGPQAIKAWFYPGRTTGHEFIYPRSQAMKLAARTGESVLTTKTDSPAVAESVAEQDMSRVDRSGADSAVAAETRTAETTTAQTTSAQTTNAQATAPRANAASSQPPTQTPPANVQAPAQPAPATRTAERTEPARTDRSALPATASLLPLLGLVGIGSLLASRFVRGRRLQ